MESLKVRTTVIANITKGDLDRFYFLDNLKIEANHFLKHLEPGLFRNMSRLQQLSISYNVGLQSLREGTFEGLTNLKNLSLVNNFFSNLADLTALLKPSVLPTLEELDVSENSLENIFEKDFSPLTCSPLRRLKMKLCSLEYVHPESFVPLRKLTHLSIGQNNLNSSMVGNFLLNMTVKGINLTFIDLSGMGFRKQPPRELLDIMATTTISRLILADNHFEIITDDTFPRMQNIEEINLNRVFCLSISPRAFDRIKFPRMQVLLLSGNNLYGKYQINIPSDRLLVMDLSSNGDRTSDDYYYNIDKNAFLYFKELRVLNLAYNAVKSIYNYTFSGLDNLRILNLENSSVYTVADASFKPLRHLQLLNLANNPLGRSINLTGSTFDGLEELKVLILKNCGINKFNESENPFEKMPNINTLVLRKNLLRYLTAEILKPLKKLKILDLRDNILVSWCKPLFLSYGVRPTSVYLTNNKMTHFTPNMLLDINYLIDNRGNDSVVVNLLDNVFDCDCHSMYRTYLWLRANGSIALKDYFYNSKFLCDNRGAWEDRRVASYLSALPSLQCSVHLKSISTLLLVWTAPTLVTVVLLTLLVALIYKYRVHINYWIFISKIALGRKFIRKSCKGEIDQPKRYKYDGFVSYSSEDRDFIAKMIFHMEATQPQLKLCIYERDFEIGSFISESVSNSINESRYIVLVISNNFAKSQWCRWETHLAEYRRLFLEDGTSYDPLVLIKIGDVESKYLTTTLKYLLKTKIYHSWNEKESQGFWAKLKNVLMKK